MSKKINFNTLYFYIVLVIVVLGLNSFAPALYSAQVSTITQADKALLELQRQVGGEKEIDEISQEKQIPKAEGEQAEIKTSGEGLVTRVAPGEFLPFSVKLINFGETRRVDVTIKYQILDSEGLEAYSEVETVAVETTASFVKQIQLPDNIATGRYTAVSNILYEYQEVPATSQFQFSVERKIAGIFQSTFILYSIVTILIGIAFAVISRLVMKRKRESRLTPHDYSNIPKDKKIFYEIISDTIRQMRFRAGDDALEVASYIQGLEIDPETGKVLNIKKDPAKIIALLILRYETLLGRKVSFAPRKHDDHAEEKLVSVKKNVEVVRKYFE